jgi:hypothetical protein
MIVERRRLAGIAEIGVRADCTLEPRPLNTTFLLLFTTDRTITGDAVVFYGCKRTGCPTACNSLFIKNWNKTVSAMVGGCSGDANLANIPVRAVNTFVSDSSDVLKRSIVSV